MKVTNELEQLLHTMGLPMDWTPEKLSAHVARTSAEVVMSLMDEKPDYALLDHAVFSAATVVQGKTTEEGMVGAEQFLEIAPKSIKYLAVKCLVCLIAEYRAGYINRSYKDEPTGPVTRPRSRQANRRTGDDSTGPKRDGSEPGAGDTGGA